MLRLAAVLLAFPLVAAAGPRAKKTCDGANLALKSALAAGKLPYLQSSRDQDALNRQCGGENETLRRWSSSFLKPLKREPTWRMQPGVTEGPDGNESFHDTVDYLKWCGQYSAFSVVDGNGDTAWCEGVAGDGLGEILISPSADATQKVEIQVGIGRVDTAYKKNGRPQKVRVYVVEEPEEGRFPCPEYGLEQEKAGAPLDNKAWKSLLEAGARPVARREVTLRDTPELQPLALPEFKAKPGHIYFVALELLGVVAGSTYQDTCIAELRNVSAAPR